MSRTAPRHRRSRPHSARRLATVLAAIVALVVAGIGAISANAAVPAGSYPKAPRSLEDPARAPYGSGPHGGWLDKTPSISTDAKFQEMHDTNGVLLIGDSIARQAANELAQRLWDDHRVVTAVNNWPSRPCAPAVDWLEDHQAWIPDRGIVMACGANDIFNPAQWWRNVNRVLEIADGRPVYWIAVYVDRWSLTDPDQRAADMRNSAWVNQQLYATANAYPNLKVVDWHAWLSQGYNESKIADVLSDGVHLTSPVGIDNWVDLLTLKMGL
jgi:hypothetical protein